jgi:hypothetical protein
VARLVSASEPGYYTEAHIRSRLEATRENWMEWRDECSNRVLTRAEIWREMDKWLDALSVYVTA